MRALGCLLTACSTWLLAATPSPAAEPPGRLTVDWDRVTRVVKTSATLQVVVNPPLRRGSAIHDRAFAALRELHADYARFVPWMPYPRLAVAELEPPPLRDPAGHTAWDFSLLDPLVLDFLDATAGHPVVFDFSTSPQWLWTTPAPVPYPADPDSVTWDYQQGSALRDPSAGELAAYYARLAAWYTQGGFVDELGRRHESGHRHHIDCWEVLNEVDFERGLSPQQYVTIYDAVVQAVRRVAPGMRFVALSLAQPGKAPEMFEHFLDRRNHRPGVPLDLISYHFYAVPSADQPLEAMQYTFFDQAEGFLNTVRSIEAIRRRLSPETGTLVDEVGTILPDDLRQGEQGHVRLSVIHIDNLLNQLMFLWFPSERVSAMKAALFEAPLCLL